MSSGGDNIILSSTQAVATSSAANVSLMKLGTLAQTIIGIVITGAVIGATVTTVALISVRVGVSAPVANPDYATVFKTISTDIYPLVNDRDSRGANLTIVSISQPLYGKTTLINGKTVKYQSNPYYAGPDNFNYTVTNDKLTATATVFITVLDQPPQAPDFTFQVSKNSVDNLFDMFNIVQNQLRIMDVDNDILHITEVSNAENGVASTNGTHVFYTPNFDSREADIFNYTVTDRNLTATATISIVVLNNPPVATPDAVVAPKNTEIVIDVLKNDMDPNNDNITIVELGASKSVQRVREDGSVVYLPLPVTEPYSDSFEYTISDGDLTTTSYVTISMTNTPPVAFNNTVTIVKNTENNIIPIGMKDSDILDSLVAYLNQDSAEHGTATLQKTAKVESRFFADNWYSIQMDSYSISYTPRHDAVASDVIEFLVTDGYDTTSGFVQVTIINQAPVAVDDVANCSKNLQTTVDLLNNDYDPNKDKIVLSDFTSLDTELGGKIERLNDQQVRYTAPKGVYPGRDSVEYTIRDVQESSENDMTATATLYIDLYNEAPVAQDDEVTVVRKKTVVVNVLANDSDPNGDSLTITSVDSSDASIIESGKNISYTAGNNIGSYQFNYDIEDVDGASASATVTVKIVNIKPVPSDDSITTLWNRVVTFDVISNDNDENDDTLTIYSYTTPSNGVLTKVDNSNFRYTPNQGYVGTDSFTYTVSDGFDESERSATVTIEVVNHAPSLSPDYASTHWRQSVDIAILANDTDTDGDSLTITNVSTPSFGTAQIIKQEDGTDAIKFTPTMNVADATFTYTASDGNLDSTTTVTVNVWNTVPVAADDSISIHWISNEVQIEVLDNDSDADGDSISIDRFVLPDGFKGEVSISADRTALIYNPNEKFVGTQEFTYFITDGPSNTASAKVSITHTNNNVPAAGNKEFTVHWKTQTTGNVFTIFSTATPTDEDGDALTYTVTQAANGVVTNETSDTSISLRYTQRHNFLGTDSFVYTVSDGVESADTTVTYTVYNTKPTSSDFSTSAHWNAYLPSGITVDAIVAADASDEDRQDTVSLKSVTPNGLISGKGTVSFTDSKITFVPVTGFVGSVEVSVEFTDGIESSVSTYTITVQNIAPVATPTTTTAHWRSLASGYAVEILGAITDGDSDPVTFTISGQKNATATIQGSTVVLKQATPIIGTATVTVQYTDGWKTATATWTVVVANSIPTAIDQSYSTHWRITSDLFFDVLNGASDLDNADTVTLQGITTIGTVGNATKAGSLVKYAPAAAVGTDSFKYSVTDGLATVTKSVSVQVTNTLPVPANDAVTLPWRTKMIDIPVLANDVDANNDPITVNTFTNPSKGSVAKTATGISYEIASPSAPTSASLGTYTFNYNIKDGVQTSASTAQVSVTVTNNNKPAATNFERNIHWRDFTAVPFVITTSQKDGDDDTYSVSVTSNPTQFVVSLDNTASGLTYKVDKPTASWTGTGSGLIQYTLTDGIESAVGEIDLTVFNNAPTTSDFSLDLHWSLLQQGTTFNVLAKAGDVDTQDKNNLIISSLDTSSLPAGAVAEIRTDSNGQKVVFYKPAPDVRGTDTITYYVSDGLATTPGTISVTVSSFTISAEDQFYSFHWAVTPQDLPLIDRLNSSIPTLILDSPLIQEPDQDGTVTIETGSEPRTVTYQQATGYLGTEVFKVGYKDGSAGSVSTITVTVDVTNTPPTAQSSTQSLHRTQVASGYPIDLAGLISDADTDSLTISSVTKLSGASGNAVWSTGTVVTYTPTNTAYVGTTEGFTYTVSDGIESRSGTVGITVYNNRPVTYKKTVTTHWRNLLSSNDFIINVNTGAYPGGPTPTNVDYDPDTGFDTISIVGFSTTSLGSAASVDQQTGAQVKFSLNEPVTVNTPLTFSYTITDGATNGQVTQSVEVTGTNAAPVANADSQDIHWKQTNVAVDVLANDIDTDSDDLTIVSATSSVTGATVTIASSKKIINYTPKSGYTGTDTVTYRITDGAVTVTGTATIRVFNNAPTASAISQTKKWSEIPTSGLVIPVLGTSSVSDADGDSLTLTYSGVPSGMSVSVSGNNLVFKPSQGFVGPASFDYSVSDGLASATARVTVTVQNNAPTATTNTFTRHWRTRTGALNLASYFSDVDLDTVVFTAVSQGINGGATSFTGLVVTYTQANNYVGTDKFTVSYTDTWSAVKTVDFQVQVTNNVPTVYQISMTAHPTTFVIPITTRSDALKATDSDAADGSFLTVSNSFSGTYPAGTSITTDGSSVTIVPVAGSLSTITVRYTVSDGVGSSSANIVLTLTNNVPSIQPFNQALHWRSAPAGTTFNLLAGAIDADSDTLSIVSVTGAQGTATRVGSTSSYKFVAPANTLGSFTWSYVVSDGYAQVTGSVTITVNDAAPQATSFTVEQRWSSPSFSIPITSRVTDSDTQDGSFLQFSDVASPFATLSGDGKSIQFSKTVSASDIDSAFTITYRGFDGLLKSDVQTITVYFRNEAPNASPFSTSIKWNAATEVELVALCSDAVDSVSVTRINGVAIANIASLNSDSSAQATIKGRLTVTDSSRAKIKYEPTSSMAYAQSGAAKSAVSTWTFTCSDGLLTKDATVTITVTNNQPSADDKTYTFARVAGRTQYTISNFVPSPNTDPVDGDALSLINVQGATISGNDAIVTVDASTTVKTFTFQFTDGQLSSRVATATVNFGNVAPSCVASSATINKGASATFQIASLCTDDNGDTVSFSSASSVSSGSVSFTNNVLTYTAGADRSGVVTFTYIAQDPLGAKSTARTITITVVNRAPTASDSTWSIFARRDTNVATLTASSYLNAANAADQDSYDSTRLSISQVQADTCGSFGSLAVQSGNIVFTRQYTFSSGSCSFRVTVQDADVTNPLTVTRTVTVTVSTSGLNANGRTISVRDQDAIFLLSTGDITLSDNDPLGGTFVFDGFLFDTCNQDGFCRAGTTPVQNGNQWQFTSKSANCQIDRYRYRIRSVQDPSIIGYAVLNVQYTNCVCNVPMDLVLVFDSSGSVGAQNFQKMKDFAVSLVNNFVFAGDGSDPNKNARMGVVRFSDSDKINTIQSMTNVKATVANAISNMQYVAGGTWILDGIRAGENMLATQGRSSVSNKVMLVLFDGEPNGPCDCQSCRSRYSSVSSDPATQERQCLSPRFPHRTCNPCDLAFNFELKCNPCSDIVPLCTTINGRKPSTTTDGSYWRIIPVGIGQALSNPEAQQLLRDMSYDPNRSFYVDWDQLTQLFQTVSDQTCNLVDIGGGSTQLTVVEPNEPESIKCGDIVSIRVPYGYLTYYNYNGQTNALMADLTTDPNTPGNSRVGLWQVVCDNKQVGDALEYGMQVSFYNLQAKLYMRRIQASRNNDLYVAVTGTAAERATGSARRTDLLWKVTSVGFSTSGKVYKSSTACLGSVTRTSGEYMLTYPPAAYMRQVAAYLDCLNVYENFYLASIPWSQVNNKNISPAISGSELPMPLSD